ncbi:MAG: hypothetical protein Ct9H300mP13_5470 [Gammaproteobacteria bacterium]|nr:MAG: hypothetical protein Ct9H300mP13_5470 [Gammaproteobacteria bacterium]
MIAINDLGDAATNATCSQNDTAQAGLEKGTVEVTVCGGDKRVKVLAERILRASLGGAWRRCRMECTDFLRQKEKQRSPERGCQQGDYFSPGGKDVDATIV